MEVHNTHLERHLYTLQATSTEGPFVASMDKTFYVSPFIEMEGSYAVRVQDDPAGLRIAITESRGPDRVLSTGLVLRRMPFSDRALGRLLVRHPFVTFKTIAFIHWHALRLWLRGARFHRHGDAVPMTDRSMARTATSRSEPFLDAAARRVGLAAASRIRVGRLTLVLPDGRRRTFGDPGSTITGEMHIHDAAAARRLLLGGDMGAGEAYMDGLWSSPDLPALLRLGALNRSALALSAGWWRLPYKLARTVAHRARRNTVSQARRNIAAHYDLGNDFYRLFLDETMTYSSAVFETPDQSLADAQRNKYRVIAERAGLRRGQHVLEIGTGWGGFALYAAGELGCRVTTVTISRAQHDLALERVRAAGLADRVDVQLRDYREVEGRYDAIVSIEMLEAVGEEYLSTFFELCDRVLVTGGRLSLQSISFPDAMYEIAAARCELDPDLHLPGWLPARRWRPSSGRPEGPACW